ncbi:uncharacterized protein LOC128238847 [Mya arenaria]|uniref:uncharacterized protein LOC128238847 n=1 Tax=Mya arenaria TaxID=6604 RepID=UPI0022E1CE4B|nr:uncharacterized protein LOC128238847 [Mya arenaria]
MSQPNLNARREVIPTWRVYPRAHYYRRRLLDLFPRFKRVIGAFPSSFHNTGNLQYLEKLTTIYDMTLEINVIGNEPLLLDNILVDPVPLKEETFAVIDPAGVKISVCFIKWPSIDEHFEKILNQAIDRLKTTRKSGICGSFFFLNVENEATTEQQFLLKTFILGKIEDKEHCHVVFDNDGVKVADEISKYLEQDICIGFHKIYDHLRWFYPADKRSSGSPLADLEQFIKCHPMHSTMFGFLQDALKHDSDDVEEMETESELEQAQTDKSSVLTESAMQKLARMYKCNVVHNFILQKYPLSTQVCNLMLEEAEFEKRFKESVSENTKSFMMKAADQVLQAKGKPLMHRTLLKKGSKRTFKEKEIRYDWLVDKVVADISKLVFDVEKSLESALRYVEIVRKMAYEVEGYLQQADENFHLASKAPDVSQELRKALLKLSNVYAVGTMYDEFAVYVRSQTLESGGEPMTEDRSYYNAIEREIRSLIKEHNYVHSYTVKIVTKELQSFVLVQHEHGKTIHSPWPDQQARSDLRQGTLGGFAVDEANKLYALTCAHVVNNPNNTNSVFVHESGAILRLLGECDPQFSLLDNEMRIDFAAVKVEESIEPNCIRFLKDEDGMYRVWKVFTGCSEDLRRQQVYKFGGRTQLTCGLIVCVDWELASPNLPGQQNPVASSIVIDTMPGSGEHVRFAEEGDSGAVACMMQLLSNAMYRDNRQARVSALSMIHKGGMQIHGVSAEQTASFDLQAGFDNLRTRGIATLSPPV